MSGWHSLYFPNAEQSRTALLVHQVASAQGYTAYNPFGLMPSKPHQHSLRLFAAPAENGWVRLLSAQPTDALLALATDATLLRVSLVGANATLEAYDAGQPVALESIVSHEEASAPALRIQPKPHDALMNALPDDLQRLASKVDAKQAQKMINSLSGELLGKAGGSAAAARSLIDQPDAPQWASADGARILAFMNRLRPSFVWQSPDFVTLRDAYQAAARKQRNPNATLFPGDAEAIASVPNALDYTPLFFGKDA
jgi:hypothetical protein